jgi:uncharacterized protein (DUF488 family)
MKTDAFAEGIRALLEIAAPEPTAILCAEAVPWRCHRSLVSDALVARGVKVLHITGKSRPSEHALTSFARVAGERVTYPGDSTPLG